MRGIKKVNEFWKGIFGSLEAEEKNSIVNMAADKLPPNEQAKLDAMLNPCVHKWIRGMLPGQKYIGICSRCGARKDVNKQEWDTLG